MRVFAHRSICVVVALVALGCPQTGTPGDVERPRPREDRRPDDDARVDPSRCMGEALDLRALIDAGTCTIDPQEARALPGPDQLAIEATPRLRVEPGGRLDFELLLRNLGKDELVVDLAFRRLLPLGPERTEIVDGGSVPDPSCTLWPMSTEPPPERVTLPPKAELSVPCQWFANTRLVDPRSYVGSECADFPPLTPGRYRSVFVVGGGKGSSREVAVEIVVR